MGLVHDTSIYFSGITGQLVVYKGKMPPAHFGRLSQKKPPRRGGMLPDTLTLTVEEARQLIAHLLGYHPEEKC